MSEQRFETWPGIEVDPGTFASHVEALRRSGGARPEHLAELSLAHAAARGDAAGLPAFDKHILQEVLPSVRRVDASEDFLDEVRQVLRARLLVGQDGAPPRIAGYTGRGPLAPRCSSGARRSRCASGAWSSPPGTPSRTRRSTHPRWA
ncbi:hypothetical protein [Corallococcus sicarius]|uniref:hypothetical protein n=1 Tax=Corallococcus sicarius TaxID=2316726 RepID=UPI0011C36570|nr:hypothetical protein [Corallococcus sicarius]